MQEVCFDKVSHVLRPTQQHLNPRHLHECMDRILVEVTKAAVKTAERKLGVCDFIAKYISLVMIMAVCLLQRRSLVDEARKSGYEHIVCFFEQFFASPDVCASLDML